MRGEDHTHRVQGGVKAVSVNLNNGNIVVLVDGELMLFDINGKVLARQCTGGVGGGGGGVTSERDEGGGFKAPSFHRSTSASNFPLATTAVSTNCPTYMTLGVVAVSGHRYDAIEERSDRTAASILTIVLRSSQQW